MEIPVKKDCPEESNSSMKLIRSVEYASNKRIGTLKKINLFAVKVLFLI